MKMLKKLTAGFSALMMGLAVLPVNVIAEEPQEEETDVILEETETTETAYEADELHPGKYRITYNPGATTNTVNYFKLSLWNENNQKITEMELFPETDYTAEVELPVVPAEISVECSYTYSDGMTEEDITETLYVSLTFGIYFGEGLTDHVYFGDITVEYVDSLLYDIRGTGMTEGGEFLAYAGDTSVTNAKGGTEIVFRLDPAKKYILENVNVTDENGNEIAGTLSDDQLSYTIEMPYASITADPEIIQIPVEYQIPDEGTETCYEYTAMTGSTKELINGWYVLFPESNFQFNDNLEVYGEVNLILCDGASIHPAYGVCIHSEAVLNIWGQTLNSGELNADVSSVNTVYLAGIEVLGSLVINGGKITATSKAGSASIGGGLNASNGDITINGGNVTARTSTAGGAGIGGGSGAANGKITINGGTVNAYSYTGAGIGGGSNWNADSESGGSGGIITINGGDITVSSGDYGAGIGGGGGVHGMGTGGGAGTITISGGKINATGGTYAAGIGAGSTADAMPGPGGTITISGGTVTAKGGYYGAGIGGAVTGSGGNITISGGNVTATSGDNAAGIGGGAAGSGGTITISGGTVRAKAGAYGRGLGNGVEGDGADIKLSWTNYEKDSLMSEGIYGTVTLQRNFKVAETEEIFERTSSADTNALSRKVLVPCNNAHTLSFSANGGSGSMPSMRKEIYIPFELPDCDFTPPAGKHFAGWDIGGTIYGENDMYTISQNTAAKAVWEDDSAVQFEGHQLVLSGSLGLRFGVKFPADIDSTGSYVTFTVSGQEQTAQPEDGGDRMVYTCYLNTLQMAEQITAVLHYGDGQTLTQTYSLTDYFNYFDGHASTYNEKTLALVHAVANYGYFAYPYLVQLHHLEGKYTPITKYYETSFDEDAIKAAVAQYTFAKGISDSQVSAASYKLSLDSDTALSVMVKVPAGTEVSASASFNGNTYEMTQDSNTVWSVKIPGIKASQLGDTITVSGTAGGNFTINVSALSYVRSVLNSDKYKGDAKNAVMALYKYYEAVKAY